MRWVLVLLALTQMAFSEVADFGADDCDGVIKSSMEKDREVMACKAFNPPANPLKAACTVVWGVFLLGLGTVLAFFAMTKKKADSSCVKAFAASSLLEGVSAVLTTVYLITLDPSMQYPWGLGFQFLSVIPMYFAAFCFFFYGHHWSKVRVLGVVTLVGCAAMLLSLCWMLLGPKNGSEIAGATPWPANVRFDQAMGIFRPWYVYSLIFFAFCAWYVVGSVKDNLREAAYKFLWGFLVTFFARLANVVLGNTPAVVLFVILLIGGTTVASRALLDLTALHAFDHAVFDDWELDKDVKKQIGDVKTRYEAVAGQTSLISPERMWTIGCGLVISGYAASAFCLFAIRWQYEPELFEVDPIIHLYDTLHPCILLDYLPGTLFAQPCFDLACVFSQVAVLFALVRAALMKDKYILMISAISFGIFIPLSIMFNWVFTWNPTVTNVLFHSVPYMSDNISKGAWCMLNTYILWHWHELSHRGRVMTTLTGGFYTCAILYGTFFMSGKLMGDEHLGDNLISLLSNSTTDKKDLGPVPGLDFFPIIVTVTAQICLFTFGLVSPLWYRPVAAEIKPYELASKNKEGLPSRSERSTQSDGNWFRITRKHCFFFFVLSVLFFSFTAKFLNSAVHGDDVLSNSGYRKLLVTQPGNLVVSFGWIICAEFLVAYLFCTVSIERDLEKRGEHEMSKVTTLLAILLAILSLCAHSGSIPDGIDEPCVEFSECWYKTTDWFKGPEVFLLVFSFWLFWDVVVLFKRRSNLDDDTCTTIIFYIEVGVAVIGGLGFFAAGISRLINSVDTGSKWTSAWDWIWQLSCLVYSVVDSRKVVIDFVNIRIASVTDVHQTRHEDKFRPFLLNDEEGVNIAMTEEQVLAKTVLGGKDYTDAVAEK